MTADEGTGFPMGAANIQIWNSFPHCDEKNIHLWQRSGHYCRVEPDLIQNRTQFVLEAANESEIECSEKDAC